MTTDPRPIGVEAIIRYFRQTENIAEQDIDFDAADALELLLEAHREACKLLDHPDIAAHQFPEPAAWLAARDACEARSIR